MRTPFALDALKLSITTTTAALILTLVFGTPLAVLLACGQFRGRSILDTLCDLPMTLPPAVGGLALLLTFGRNGMFGPALSFFGISLPFTISGNVGSSRPEAQLACLIYITHPPIQKATFCRTSASAEC